MITSEAELMERAMRIFQLGFEAGIDNCLLAIRSLQDFADANQDEGDYFDQNDCKLAIELARDMAKDVMKQQSNRIALLMTTEKETLQ